MIGKIEKTLFIDKKEILNEAKKMYRETIENEYKVLKLSKRGDVIYAVLENKNTREVKGEKVVLASSNNFNDSTEIRLSRYSEESGYLRNKLFNLNEMILFTESEEKNDRYYNLIKINYKLIEEQYWLLKNGKDVKSKKVLKQGDLVEFEEEITFHNGDKVKVLRFNKGEIFAAVDDIYFTGLRYNIKGYKYKKFKIITENCK